MKRFVKYVKGNWLYTIMAPIFMMIDAIGSIVQPFFMAKIIDVGIATGDVNYIVRMGIFMILIALGTMVSGFLCMYFSAKAAYGFAYNIRRDMMEKIQDFSFYNINKFKTSSLITRLTNDVLVVSQLFQMMLRIVIRAPFMFIGGTIMALLLNAKLSLILVVLIPILFIAVLIVLKMVAPLFEKVQKGIDKVNAVIRENLKGIRVIKSFVREDYMKERFNNANDELTDISIKSFGKIIVMMPLVSLVMNLAVAAIIWFGSIIAGNGGIEVGAISSFISYIMMILSSLIMMSMVFMNFARAKASSDRIMEVLEEIPDIRNSTKASDKVIKKGDISFNVLDFSFKDATSEEVLNNVKFDVKAGDMVAIIGGTGSGKSTLVNLIPRFYDVSNGYVKVDGIDVKDYDIKTLRDSVGFVLQENRLFKGTIKENIKWGKSDATDEEVIHACRVAQIDEFIDSLPDKYESIVEQKGTNFSGGQRQRLCIARALIKKPKILILDDSVSALDSTTEAKLTRALHEEFKDTTVLIITQRISSCKKCDYVVVMDNGEVVGIGPHDELIKDNLVYKEINDSQQEVLEDA